MSNSKLFRPTHLVLDFDGTLTVKDTMNVLGQLPKVSNTTWDKILKAYVEDYTVYKNAAFPWKNFDREEYSKWLASRKWVEARSALRVQDGGFFRGVTLKDIDQAIVKAFETGELEMRSGWSKLFHLFTDESNQAERGSRISIVSINWSQTFIRTTLLQAANNLGDDRLCQYIASMEIHANEIDGLDSPGGSSGRVCRSSDTDMRTSDDKVSRLLQRHDVLANHKDRPFLVYVGDSPTDFDCLCAADLGVWLHDLPEREYEQYSVQLFSPLKFIPPPVERAAIASNDENLFYWAANFESVFNAITGESPDDR